jgi:hypothetical protein
MCTHESSDVYSYVCAKASFLDDQLVRYKDHYQAFFWVLIDLIVELLVLIIKFTKRLLTNQTKQT